jgi:hypothetical protein
MAFDMFSFPKIILPFPMALYPSDAFDGHSQLTDAS